MQNFKLIMAPHGHHQFLEPFFDSDVIRIEIFGFQNLRLISQSVNLKISK
jgi:hypothetical protein